MQISFVSKYGKETQPEVFGDGRTVSLDDPGMRCCSIFEDVERWSRSRRHRRS